MTALYEAAAEGYSEIFGISLEKYGDLDLRDTKGQCLADVTEVNGHSNIAQKVKPPIAKWPRKAVTLSNKRFGFEILWKEYSWQRLSEKSMFNRCTATCL